jgi:putative ABC transport system permease protein
MTMKSETTRFEGPPRLAQAVLRRFLPLEDAAERIGDFEEDFNRRAARKGEEAARLWYFGQAAKVIPVLFKNSICGSMMMFNNYLKVAFRNLMKRKGYSFLNIAGLAVGLAVCLAIMIFVRFETSYDKFHKDSDRLVRIERQFLGPDGAVRGGFSSLAPGFVPHLEKDIPAFEKIARLLALGHFSDTFVALGDNVFQEDRFYLADSNIFDIFTLPLLEGESASAIRDPNTVVLSQAMARKYFGKESAMGKILKVENGMVGSNIFRVTGVMKDMPPNSHVQCDFLGAMSTVNASPQTKEYLLGTQNFSDNVTYIYARLAKNAILGNVAAQMPAFLDAVMPTRTDDSGRVVKPSQGNQLFLRQVTDIHLDSHTPRELEPPGDRKYIAFFTIIAAFILILACINFTNLATARAAQRAREVGLRKVVGGHRRMLAKQFMMESVLVVALSMGLAFGLVLLTLPLFNSLFGRALSLAVVVEPGSLLLIGLVFILTSVTAGLYPAVYLSAFKPAAILRGELTRGAKGALLRKILVIFQFAVTIVLIVAVGVVSRQMRFLRNADLGFDRAHIILITADNEIKGKWDDVRQSLTANPAILSASLSKRAPSGSLMDAPGFRTEVYGQTVQQGVNMPHNRVSREFFSTYAVKFVAGRDFSADFPTDESEAYILNETAVRQLGWKKPEDAIDQPMSAGGAGRAAQGRIIGVVADFNYESLHTQIKPIITYILPRQANTLSVRIAPGRMSDALAHIRSVWAKFRPGYQFKFDFLDSRLKALYVNEERMMKLFGAFSGLAVLIACLGLFGLASYAAEQRTKEIGIRKVLGASVSGLVTMFSREFARWILVANLLAWPIAYFLMDRWLRGFAYKVSMGWTIFAAAAVLTFVIAMITVASQSVRAALADPAVSLRRE